MSRISQGQLSAALESAGGFAWWYVDLTSQAEDGSIEGLVLIWSLGLPFLSGSRLAPLASSRPSLSLAIYRGGRAELYLLQQHESWGHLDGVDGSLRLGDSRFEVRRVGGRYEASIVLDEPVPGSSERLVGEVRVQGPEVPLPGSGAGLHVWSPRVLEGQGSAALRFGSRSWDLSGSAYLDGNVSTVPLHDQAIASWRWGRFHCAGRTWVFYDVSGEADSQGTRLVLGTSAHEPAGLRPDASVEFLDDRKGRYGMRAPRRIELTSPEGSWTCHARQLVDDGPFYQRFLLEVESPFGAGHGVFEVVAPTRVDLPHQRPFVSMRIHRTGRSNSVWLPLFSGPREGRWGRLWEHAWPTRSRVSTKEERT